MTQNIQFRRRKPKIPKAPVIVLSVVVAAVAVAIAVLVITHVTKEKKEAESFGKCTWSTEGFENVSDAKMLDETMIIFTDSQSKKQGIMALDGKITEQAKHESFTVVSDIWRSNRYIAKSPSISEYNLLVDAQTGTVTTRQYHGLTEPENNPYWEEKHNHLAWHDAKGYKGKVKVGELSLGDGIYPVSCPPSDGSKWGYINKNLQLEIVLSYEKAMDFSGDFAAVCKDGKWGYINREGVTKIGFDYDPVSELDVMNENRAFSFRNGLAPVKKDGKYGIINTSGETVVNFVFEAILQGKNGVYLAKKDGEWGLITIDKEQLTAKVETTAANSGDATGIPVETGSYIVKTSGDPLNIRAEANSSATKLGQIPNGATVTVSKSVGGWAYVKYSTLQGWVSAKYIVKAAANTPAVSTTAAAQ
ncbi:MAG: WG repeat-containing protein [Clostridia bacterium]|nr:WG repeat-containing protein [Clostridia bacterium]